ncbi:hypothetical protein DL767_007410 [Monosporascus sp. MG133]|nr:hypothetical protein DL767_007410 [Monosporascus sp. MG133]
MDIQLVKEEPNSSLQGEKDKASSLPLRKASENSEVERTEVERPTADGGGGGVFGGLDEGTRHRLEASAKLENLFHGLNA